MATLQKFKLLATQCAIAGSPSRSPNTSPAFQLPRRKSLKKLLRRSGSRRLLRRGDESTVQQDRQKDSPDPPEKKGFLSHTLKDLFVSSPPFENNGDVGGTVAGKVEGFNSAMNRAVEKRFELEAALSGGLAARRSGSGSQRALSGTLRYRLLRRAWRPVLVSIPE